MVSISEGERNYHCFYQLCHGADAEVRAEGSEPRIKFYFPNLGHWGLGLGLGLKVWFGGLGDRVQRLGFTLEAEFRPSLVCAGSGSVPPPSLPQASRDVPLLEPELLLPTRRQGH